MRRAGFFQQALFRTSHTCIAGANWRSNGNATTRLSLKQSLAARHIKVSRLELPFKPPVIEVQQYWHRRLQYDPANRWLRGVFYAVNRRESRPGT